MVSRPCTRDLWGLEEGLGMRDAKVVRLRKLRDTALRVRALAEALGSDRRAENRAIAISAVISWRVARVITGHLRAHPNLSYQKGPSQLRYLFIRAAAMLVGTAARYRGRVLPAYAARLQCLARELADARALIWEPDWGDTLGRAQRQIRQATQDIAAVSDQTAPSRADASARLSSNERATGDARIAADWPYLAI